MELWTIGFYTTYNPCFQILIRMEIKVDRLVRWLSGRWGLTQDDWDLWYYSSAGWRTAAYGFQVTGQSMGKWT